jgi:hypothetical protein
MHPLPLPDSQLPSPNGYDDFVAAGSEILGRSPILNTVAEPKSTDELAAEVTKFSKTYERIRLGLSKPCEVPLWPEVKLSPLNAWNFTAIQQIRTVARALSREAELAQQQSRFRDAAMISIDNMRAGQALSRGGLIVHYLVGIAMQGIGQWTLYPAISHLDADACREAVAALEEIDREREPLQSLFHRERIYAENAWGWYGHLQLLLNDIGGTYQEAWEATTNATLRTAALTRLLTMEMALRAYYLENNRYPQQLDDLVPDFASAVPLDPFEAGDRPLHYSRASDGYVLYSVGYDRDDDAGRPSPRDSGYFDDGDIRLDEAFKPEEPIQTGADYNQSVNESDNAPVAEAPGEEAETPRPD